MLKPSPPPASSESAATAGSGDDSGDDSGLVQTYSVFGLSNRGQCVPALRVLDLRL